MREGEILLLLEKWLIKKRRIRGGTLIARELSWLGRRVDLATLTASGCLTAYEIKTRNNLRVIEQAARNAQSFQRSYIVTATPPSTQNRRLASALNVGVIAVADGEVRQMSSAPKLRQPPQLSRRLKEALETQVNDLYV